MPEITAQLVKQLRDRTGAGMMECKKALEEAAGDLNEAEVVLRKRGIASAAKKADRVAKQGLIGTLVDGASQLGVLVEVNCESDFVARTEDFQELLAETAQVVAHAPAAAGNPEALLNEPTVSDPAVKMVDFVKSKIAKLGENMTLGRSARFATSAGVVGSYIHPGAQLGVLIELTTTAAPSDVQDLVKDLAMQVAAADPRFIQRADVDPAVLEKEREIQKARVMAEGKPEKIAEKIVEGRLSKFYEEVCLLEQPFIKDNGITVGELVKQKSAKAGQPITVAQFVRYKIGEGAEAAS